MRKSVCACVSLSLYDVGAIHKRIIDIYNHQIITTPNNGYLGSREDEERSEMRYVV